MKCPDCGGRLTEVAVESGLVMRCFRCGGVWVDSFVANRIKAVELSVWRRITIPAGWSSGGGGVCPVDRTQLVRYQGENMPAQLNVSRCLRCGRWWFPGDSFFDYKPAIEAKTNYFRLWGMAVDFKAMMLPVLSLVLLLTGAAVGIQMVERRQGVLIQAQSEISQLVMSYLGGGRALVVFKTDNPDIRTIEYRLTDSMEDWREVLLEKEGDLSVVRLEALDERSDYSIKIAGREYVLYSGVR